MGETSLSLRVTHRLESKEMPAALAVHSVCVRGRAPTAESATKQEPSICAASGHLSVFAGGRAAHVLSAARTEGQSKRLVRDEACSGL